MEFSPIRVGEQDIFTFNFTKNIPSGATIIGTPAVTVTVARGEDSSPQDMSVATPVAVGMKVNALIAGLVANNIYMLSCIVQTSANQTLEKVGRLLVLPARTPENLLLDSTC